MKKGNKTISIFTFIFLVVSFVFTPVNLVMADDKASDKATADSDKDADKNKEKGKAEAKGESEEEPECE